MCVGVKMCQTLMEHVHTLWFQLVWRSSLCEIKAWCCSTFHFSFLREVSSRVAFICNFQTFSVIQLVVHPLKQLLSLCMIDGLSTDRSSSSSLLSVMLLLFPAVCCVATFVRSRVFSWFFPAHFVRTDFWCEQAKKMESRVSGWRWGWPSGRTTVQ